MSTQNKTSQTTSFYQDIVNRPDYYLEDLKNCAPLSFGTGNTAFAAATGVVGGFAVGALPAVAVQGGVTAFLAFQQAQATYKGENYSAPIKTLAISNWVSAGAMIVGALMAGTPAAIAMASLPATMFFVWGMGHWNLNKFVSRIEELQTECHEHGLSEEETKAIMDGDEQVSQLLKKFQVQYGIADTTAIISAAAKGENIQELSTNFANAISSWESIIPLSTFAIGLAKAFSEKAANKIDQYTPGFMKPLFKTPNAAYKTGYAATGAIVAANALGANLDDARTVIEAAIKTAGDDETMMKIIAYASWAHAYGALDAQRIRPISADEYQQWKDKLHDSRAMFSLFEDAVQNMGDEETIACYTQLNEQMIELYENIPDKFSTAKDQLFGFLEILAAKAPSEADQVRAAIMHWAEEGDARSMTKMERLRSIDPQSGMRNSGVIPPARPKAAEVALEFARKLLPEEKPSYPTAAGMQVQGFVLRGGQ